MVGAVGARKEPDAGAETETGAAGAGGWVEVGAEFEEGAFALLDASFSEMAAAAAAAALSTSCSLFFFFESLRFLRRSSRSEDGDRDRE